ncbi:MAG: hypothetical protein DRP97_01940 [Candidatus Latescibacterota bacterium]|nr:MAG: hypothetical protein DRP97_01940 [Candidatus Latescibacterota bacterium]
MKRKTQRVRSIFNLYFRLFTFHFLQKGGQYHAVQTGVRRIVGSVRERSPGGGEEDSGGYGGHCSGGTGHHRPCGGGYGGGGRVGFVAEHGLEAGGAVDGQGAGVRGGAGDHGSRRAGERGGG